MAVPHLVSVFNAFLEDAIELLAIDGLDLEYEASSTHISTLLNVAAENGILAAGGDLQSLSELIVHMRNCIVHKAGRVTEGLARRRTDLPTAALKTWQADGGSGLHLIKGTPITLAPGDVVAVLTVLHRRAVELNDNLVHRVSAATWASVVAGDYRATYERLWNKQRGEARRQRVRAYARREYAAVEIDPDLLDAATSALVEPKMPIKRRGTARGGRR